MDARRGAAGPGDAAENEGGGRRREREALASGERRSGGLAAAAAGAVLGGDYGSEDASWMLGDAPSDRADDAPEHDWAGAAGAFSYASNDGEPDWMYGGGSDHACVAAAHVPTTSIALGATGLARTRPAR